jgi:hypothetical protein
MLLYIWGQVISTHVCGSESSLQREVNSVLYLQKKIGCEICLGQPRARTQVGKIYPLWER